METLPIQETDQQTGSIPIKCCDPKSLKSNFDIDKNPLRTSTKDLKQPINPKSENSFKFVTNSFEKKLSSLESEIQDLKYQMKLLFQSQLSKNNSGQKQSYIKKNTNVPVKHLSNSSTNVYVNIYCGNSQGNSQETNQENEENDENEVDNEKTYNKESV
ncbi:hypothetical protein NUSPORA_02130 [Nucleospora cyclopteri]